MHYNQIIGSLMVIVGGVALIAARKSILIFVGIVVLIIGVFISSVPVTDNFKGPHVLVVSEEEHITAYVIDKDLDPIHHDLVQAHRNVAPTIRHDVTLRYMKYQWHIIGESYRTEKAE